MEFCTTGYQTAEPIPYLSSPFGPAGILKGLLISIGTKSSAIFENAVQMTGFSPVVAQVVVGIGFILIAFGAILASILILFWITEPKAIGREQEAVNKSD
jgi:hypothetical protein